jgi:hypothetical protein
MKAVWAIAVVAVFASLGHVPHAQAGGRAITTPGSACVLQGKVTQEGLLAIRLNQQGVSNDDPQVRRDVVCPVIRSGEGGDLVIFVDGKAGEGDARLACRVQSRSIDGKLFAQKTFDATTTPFSIPVLFKFAEAPQFSYQTVICTLPPNRQATIHGITALEE